MSKKKYHHYTSKGANLHEAHMQWQEYHEANHRSFFNMNNAAGLFKLVIVGGIILVVIVLLSPLFKLFKDLVGAGQAGTDFVKNVLGVCKSKGTCIPDDPNTGNPDAGLPGTCDGKGDIEEGTVCKAWPLQQTQSDTPAPTNECGDTLSGICKTALIGWLFSVWIGVIISAIGGAIALYKHYNPGKQGNELESLRETKPTVAEDIVSGAAEEATPEVGDEAAQGETINNLADKVGTKLEGVPTEVFPELGVPPKIAGYYKGEQGWQYARVRTAIWHRIEEVRRHLSFCGM